MACAKEWGVLLSKYVDAEATSDERRLVESHLTSCKDCVGTWELFRRNEKILESALAGEAFGDLVVDDVMAELRRLETPPVVAPAADAGGSRWEKVRAWMPTSVAAALLLATLAIWMTSRQPDTTQELASVRQTNRLLYERLIELQTSVNDRDRENVTYARIGSKSEVVLTGKLRGEYESFDVERREGSATAYSAIAKGLKDPKHTDRIEPGVAYLYRFVGHRKDGTLVYADPIPVQLLEPGGLDSRTSLKVTFVGATSDLTTATFWIERVVDGTTWKQDFQVQPGEKIGGVVRGVDYATHLYLDRVVYADRIKTYGDRAHTFADQKVTLRAIDSPPTAPSRDMWRDEVRTFPLP